MEDKLSVRGQIISAFEDVPLPAEGKIIAQVSAENEVEGRRITEALMGKAWEDFSIEFLYVHPGAFSSFSACAFHYYVPALLIASLESSEIGAHDYLNILFELSPSANSIYYKGSDSHFDLRTSLFTERQFRAVAAYLGLFLYGEPDEVTFRAGKVFRWGWDRFETPERSAFRDFYHRMHHFRYPSPANTLSAKLVNEVRAAFTETPYPGDDYLAGSDQGDESAECALEFLGLDWRGIHPKLLAANYGSLGLLTHEAFVYFLPAYLIADLTDLYRHPFGGPTDYLTRWFRQPKSLPALEKIDISFIRGILGEDFSHEELLALIKPSDDQVEKTDWFKFGVERMSLFSRRERQAIIRYLEHKAELDPDSASEITSALDRYWVPSLDEEEET